MTTINNTKDFLSKENTTFLYKTICSQYHLDNLSIENKQQIITYLIDSMKIKYKTLDLSKINNGNYNMVKKQFNDLAIKSIDNVIQPIINTNINVLHDRKFDRDFTSNPQKVSVSNRPVNSLNEQSTASPSAKNTNSPYLQNINRNLGERLKELEESRRIDTSRPVVEMPDFLKPINVGKNNTKIANNTTNANNATNANNTTNTTNANNPPTLLGYGTNMELSNFGTNTEAAGKKNITKYNEMTSIQDRLSQIEKDRQLPQSSLNIPVSSNISTFFTIDPRTDKVNNNTEQSSTNNEQILNNTKQSSTNTEQFSNNIKPLSNNIETSSNNIEISVPSVSSTNMIQNNNDKYINELNQTINNLNIEINTLKKNYKKDMSILQLEINKIDSNYKYMFNPINNIIGIKLISYYIPPPVYNIIYPTEFIYSINDIITKISIMNGFYTIDRLIEILNQNNDLIFKLDISQKINISCNVDFKIIPNDITRKCGFNINTNNIYNNITATNLPDIRLLTKLNLYLLNLQNDYPFGILNINGSSICELNFINPISLDHLNLKYTTVDNMDYDFNGISYNLSFQIIIKE